jgi:hypothetical protein
MQWFVKKKRLAKEAKKQGCKYRPVQGFLSAVITVCIQGACEQGWQQEAELPVRQGGAPAPPTAGRPPTTPLFFIASGMAPWQNLRLPRAERWPSDKPKMERAEGAPRENRRWPAQYPR